MIFVKRRARAWVPTDISGCVLWLDASDAATFTYGTGDNVSQWNDKSSSANHATQSTGSQQPNRTGTINSLSVVTFSSGDRMALPNAFTGYTAGTLFVVGQLDADPPASGSASGPGLRMGSEGSGSHFPFTDGTIYDNNMSTTRKTAGNPTPSMATNPYLYSVVSASADWRCYVNGSLLHSTGTNTVGWRTAPTLGYDAVTAGTHLGRIAEAIIYSSALGTTDRQTVEAYLKAKWGTP